MASRTTSSSKGSRSRSSPYSRHAPRKSPGAQVTEAIAGSSIPLTPPSTSPPQPASLPTLREAYVDNWKRLFPQIQPRHDYDILLLGSGTFKPSVDGDFYTYSDTLLEESAIGAAAPELRKAQIIAETTQTLDTQERPTGVKPRPGEDDVHTRPIPHSKYSFRLWGKGLESKREYCLDFIDTATGQAENSPFSYELWVVPNRKTAWIPCPTTRIYSLERSFGIAQEDISPGQEKFVLLEGTACLLVRPEKRSVYFEVPVRSRGGDVEDLDVITFG